MVRLRPSMSTLLRLGVLGCLLMVLGGAWAAPPAVATEPILAYPFDEGAGSVAQDLAGGHEATVSGARWAEGKYGTALRFSGSATECVQTPAAADLQLAGHFTIEAWVRPEGPESFQEAIIFKEGSGAGVAGYGLKIGEFTKGRLDGFIGKEERYPYRVVDPAALPVRRWSHVALTFDGAKLHLYVNGGLIGEAASAAVKPTTGPLSIGCSKELAEGFIGKIDEVRVYDRALSAAEIGTDRDTAVLTPPSTEPVAGWLLDEGEGTSAGDHFRGHIGTVENATWTEGRYGRALQFNGTTSCVTVPFAPDLELTENFTLEAWVQPEGGFGPANVITMEDPLPAEHQEPWLFELSSGPEYGSAGGGSPHGNVREFGKSQSWSATGKERLPQYAWSHLAFSDDGTTLRLYVDGRLEGTAPAPPMAPASGPLTIGCYKSQFKGKIDNVLLYNRALPATQIEADEHNDFTPPVLELGGPLTEGVKAGTTEYPLHVHATDGGPGRPGVGVKSITISVDGVVVDQVEQACPAGSCPMDREWTYISSNYSEGPHTVEIAVTDQAGNTESQTLALAVPHGSVPACKPIGETTSTPDETLALPGGGTEAVYHADGLTLRFPRPPSGFDPLSASASELEEYDFPPRPESPSELAEWNEEMEGYKGTAAPNVCSEVTSGGVEEEGSANGANASWSGYMAFEPTREARWKGVSGWFIQPHRYPPRCPGATEASWVGIGGTKGSHRLIQIGTKFTLDNPTPELVSFYNFLSSSITHEDFRLGLPIHRGDELHATMAYEPSVETANGFLTDRTTHEFLPAAITGATFYDGSSAEFIDEREQLLGVGHSNLDNFKQVHWFKTRVKTLAGNWVDLGSVHHEHRVMHPEGGQLLAAPGALAANGREFKDYWYHCHP